MLRLSIPGHPPSVNHYVKHIAFGRSVRHYVTPEGVSYKRTVAYIADGQTVAPESDKERKKTRYRLKATVFLGTKKRGDGDNFWKCIGDGLKEAGVIHSDAAVDEWIMIIDRSERDNPRTEIEVERI